MTLPPPGTLDLGAARKAEEMVWMDSSANSTGRVSISIYLSIPGGTTKAEEMVWMDSSANSTGKVFISIYNWESPGRQRKWSVG